MTRQGNRLGDGMNRQQRRMAVKQTAKTVGPSTNRLSEFDLAAHHFRLGRVLQAEAACRAILASDNRDAHALYRLGLVAHRFKRLEIAADLLRGSIALRPDNVDSYSSLAIVLKDTGCFKEAAQLCHEATIIKPDFAEGYNTLGRVLHQQRLFPRAADAYRRAIEVDPKCAAAHLNLGILLHDMGEREASYVAFREAIRVKPDFVDAHRRYAHILRLQGRLDEAENGLRRAIAISPNEASYYSDLAIIYMKQGRLHEAVESCKRALSINPDDAGTLANLGNCLHDLGQSDEAVSAYKLAVQVEPGNPTFFSNLGTVYGTLNRAREAITAFRDALKLKPDCIKSLAGVYQQRRSVCDWTGLESDEASILTRLRSGIKLDRIPPFGLMAMPSANSADLLRGANVWAAPFFAAPGKAFVHTSARRVANQRERIRIGYLSADYFNHATAFLITELIEKHDRSRFEVIGYSYGPDDKSPFRRRLVNAFDRFVDIRAAGHTEAAQRIFDDEVDILVDLKGYTRDARTDILAPRPAPIQVNYLGYPGTMGVDFVDYIIGDPFVTPMDDQLLYSEMIVQLPHSYQPNDTKRQIAERVPTRAECHLPEDAFVFCCFNNTYKITRTFFTVWMRLLASVQNSVLWLLEANDSVQENLRREAASCGIDPSRLIFAKKMHVPEHLARHSHADLFLDTLPYNAHTTASDALWAGLPVVTCAGNAFAGRVAAGLLNAVGLPELVTSSLQQYEELALKLASDPALLEGFKQHLARNRHTAPLFDVERYTRDLERAYVHMIERLEAGSAPQAFLVKDLPPCASR